MGQCSHLCVIMGRGIEWSSESERHSLCKTLNIECSQNDMSTFTQWKQGKITSFKKFRKVDFFLEIFCLFVILKVHRDSPGRNTGKDYYVLLHGIFPTQGSNPGLPHFRQILHQLSHKGSPCVDADVKLPSQSCRCSWPRIYGLYVRLPFFYCLEWICSH